MSDKPSTSAKYDQAVARATGKDAPNGSTDMVAGTPPPGAEAMVKTYTPEQLQKHIADELSTGKFEAAPQLFKFIEGQTVEGILEGNGPEAEFTDEDTGEVTHTKTWIIADVTGAMRISILSSVQLDRKLNGFIGHHVKIARGRDTRIGKRIMTEYFVWGHKLPGGKKRQWFELSNEQRAAIEAGEDARALPPGTAS
jgi:hypothetical protein